MAVCIKYANHFQFKALLSAIFGLKISHLATLVRGLHSSIAHRSETLGKVFHCLILLWIIHSTSMNGVEVQNDPTFSYSRVPLRVARFF
jgi:hypothetical protein